MKNNKKLCINKHGTHLLIIGLFLLIYISSMLFFSNSIHVEIGYSLLSLIMLSGLIWAYIKDIKRINLKIARFNDRELWNIDDIYNKYYLNRNVDKDKFMKIWNEMASILFINPGRLRPTDRFNQELGPVKGQEFEDEIEEIVEYLHCNLEYKSVSHITDIETIDDVIMLIASNKESNIG